MIKRLVAIGFIFCCTSAAWLMLAGATSSRTYTADTNLRAQVERVWGAPQMQLPPAGAWSELVKRSVDTWASGRKKVDWYEERVTRPATLDASNINVALRLEHRQKGLLWYATYGVDFAATYTVVNEADTPRELEIALPFPSKNALFDDLRFEIEGRPWLMTPEPVDGRIVGRVAAAPGERLLLHVGYRSQGLDRWTYGFGAGIAQVRNFRLIVRTNFAAVDFPEGSISPGYKEQTEDGWMLKWDFRRLVSGVSIAITMPDKLQPGPLATQIAGFAPVSLFFFIVVLLTIGIVKRIELHPMHFFFLSAAFFAFHLLFAYLADQVSIHAAFAVAAITSLALVTSYLRLVFGTRFAFFYAGAAQLVYLVLFSYAFFFKGLTGLAITTGAIATLFVLMQATAKIQWGEIFASRAVTR
jgi:hypothetical protein